MTSTDKKREAGKRHVARRFLEILSSFQESSVIMSTMQLPYEWIGWFTVASALFWLVFVVAKGLWTTWLADLLGLSVQWNPTADSWAIVTGATDGIGLEFARALAKKGYNLLLISRSPEKLQKVKEDLTSSLKPSRQIRVLKIDFSQRDVYDAIEKEVKKLTDISVLVNNVGVSYCTPEYFGDLGKTNKDPNFVESMINVNILSCTKMIQMVISKMEEQRRGVIINLSSLSASYPTPLLSLYGATKIYVDFLSRGLQAEYASKGIIVQSVLPSYVATNMSKIRKATFLVPTPSAYVKGTLRTVGVEDRTYGYWTHKLQGFVQDRIIAGIFGDKAMTKLAFDSLQKIRAAYYRKYMQKKDE